MSSQPWLYCCCQVGSRQEGCRVDELALLEEARQQARLREVDDVRDITGAYTHADRRLELLRAFVLDIDAGLLFEGLDRLLKAHDIALSEGSHHGDNFAGQLAVIGLLQRPAGDGCPQLGGALPNRQFCYRWFGGSYFGWRRFRWRRSLGGGSFLAAAGCQHQSQQQC